MGEFNNRKVIGKTRKIHECLGCLKDIPKGSKAVNNTGYYEDFYNYYLHEECEEIIKKHSEEFEDGLWDGCLRELELVKD